MSYRFVLRQMFDIRPLRQEGGLDAAKISALKEVVNLKGLKDNLSDLSVEAILADFQTIEEKDEQIKRGAVFAGSPQRVALIVSVGSEEFSQVAINGRFPLAEIPLQNKILDSRPRRLYHPRWSRGLLTILLLILIGFFSFNFIKHHQFAKFNLLSSTLEISKEIILSDNISLWKNIISDYDVFLKILGFERPRKYLLIFQNNSEMRATGGFIGSYGLLDLDRGKITNFFVDDIYNVDGQLIDKIIPPQPIQKISTAWSMHDANWFADFPTSAQKIAWFYEKTGGPTVDGVLSFTPTIIERLLDVTGPIALIEDKAVFRADNFVDLMQQYVEIDYDKNLNQPKKILVDFSKFFFEKLSQLPKEQWPEALRIIEQALQEKQVIFYAADESVQGFLLKAGWAGEMVSKAGDFLSVVHTNINGYKTDRVIEQEIELQIEIKKDGSIMNTLNLTRRHLGGSYPWLNKVNADYLRVYLPRGAQFISSQGFTQETVAPPIDYQAQNFKFDPDVAAIEKNMIFDSPGGTQIFQESGKTVLANWVYVSPGESTALTYKYRLPFRLDLSKEKFDYPLYIQKQSGSPGGSLRVRLKLPDNLILVNTDPSWKFDISRNQWLIEDDLTIDRFYQFVISQ